MRPPRGLFHLSAIMQPKTLPVFLPSLGFEFLRRLVSLHSALHVVVVLVDPAWDKENSA
jgi:hypothetical protein